ncbi:MAG: phosphate signaling complex protein PhoU [Mariprofundaceae bacterium]|nr:phosphate signaling complex protein PhoU [Mariprofundaceae bacterium]
MPEHTLKRFDTELDELNNLIKSMFKIVRKNIKQALQALIEGDTKLAKTVIKHDEAANALEVQSDEAARNLIVHHQPAASDLRFVFAATKIVTDLERMSDMAANIADNVLNIEGATPKNLASIPVMQDLVLDQLKHVRRAYLERSATEAQTIIERDHLINEAFANTQRVMLTVMVEKPAKITQCMALINIAKIMERIGDHITNIAEMVIYTDVGHEVRHIDVEQLRRLLAEEGDDDD